MKFDIGCDLNEFKKYRDQAIGYGGEDEIYWVKENPSHLIVLREENRIIGHAIWHPSNSREHQPGDSREEEDTRLIEELLGGKGDFVELHELWLTKENRGKGYGNKLLDFFEQFIKSKGHNSVIFYAYNPAAISLCQKREYKGIFGYESTGVEGKMETMYIFHISLE